MASTPEQAPGVGFCVIMAGGRGTRFWPLSRAQRPKQLLPLGSPRSLLRDTYDRIAPLCGPARLLVVTNVDQAAAVASELPELPPERIVAEPMGRNTAACAALGIALAERLVGPGPVALIPADHYIPEPDAFRAQLRVAFAHAARTGEPVTIGIPPYRPETGYGYLEVAQEGAGPVQGVRFVEKPDRATAAAYVASGRYLWNSGIFVWESRAFAAALQRHLPQTAAALEPPAAAYPGPQFAPLLERAYAVCPEVSVDVAIMEKLASFAVLRASFAWSDLGSWDVWGALAPALAEGNKGRAELFPVDSRENIVYAPGKTVALVGVENLIVVDTPDALLVCSVRDAQRIRDVIAQLEQTRRRELL